MAGRFAAADEQPASAIAARGQPISTAVKQLNDVQFDVRERATKDLGLAGRNAIAPLLAAAEGDDLEATWRAIKAMARILDTDDEATFDAAEIALERLEASTNRSAARRAAAALDTQPDRRWNRALARFEAAGGWCVFRNLNDQGGAFPMQPPPFPLPTYFVIGSDWRGGAAELLNVKRMDSALQAKQIVDRRASIYVIDGSSVPAQAIDELQHSLKIMDFSARGKARLAVSFSLGLRGRGWEVATFEPDAAEITRNNLQKQDMIVKYDGETLIDFEHLTRITRRHEVGDKLPVEVLRNGDLVQTEVELTGWTKPVANPQGK